MAGLLDTIQSGAGSIYDATAEQVRGLLGMSPDQVAHGVGVDNDLSAQHTEGATIPDTFLKKLENRELEGFKNGVWIPHKSPEGGTPTLGWGHKITKEEKRRGTIKIGDQFVNFKKGMAPQQVNQLYEQDTATARSVARNSLKKGLGSFKPHELQSLTSLIYNVGKGNWEISKAKTNLESGDIEGFLKEAFDPKIGFVKANKKIFKGLVNRRAAERSLFIKNQP